ncbi:TPA: hypothetical protein MJE31_03480 [Klebsiella pneumoniae]|uniref:hypothetical protein n=1 Tax=Klebsiella pneumoniae TaxID=573 RepID=UPI000D1A8F6D|nr:hypothetical protein [Klebsiella pneumoniae]MBX4807439.1 hypothetical protein [Klebsiella pneumoniae]MEC3864188.1 hypothetical protein [Klebsiella pneumoniae]MEC3870333.1 hypothetical protein [Klebsiella pneumoniae]WLY13300.1 hypothetical protein RA220_10260 [Klebsiella pneumoniae]WLY24353.1 hypothetical protein RA200_10255 [Klebsiella pneumoniae]
MSKKSKKKKKTAVKAVTARKCGQCSVCCTSLLIDEPELAKPAGTSCKHLATTSGCSIYEERPEVCKSWYCGWLKIETLPHQLRPDKSKVLITINPQPGVTYQVQPINDESVTSLLDDYVLLFIRNAILTDSPVAISIPTKPGYCQRIQLISDLLRDVLEDRVAFRNKMCELIRITSTLVTDKKPEIIHIEAL